MFGNKLPADFAVNHSVQFVVTLQNSEEKIPGYQRACRGSADGGIHRPNISVSVALCMTFLQENNSSTNQLPNPAVPGKVWLGSFALIVPFCTCQHSKALPPTTEDAIATSVDVF